MNSDLEDVKRDVAAANRVLANLGLATGLTAALGHASMRVPPSLTIFLSKAANMSSMPWRSWSRTIWLCATPRDSSLRDVPD